MRQTTWPGAGFAHGDAPRHESPIRHQGAHNVADSILRLPAVKTRTGLSRSTIYLRISQGTFPRPVSLGGRAVGWLEAEIQEWLQRQIEASRKAAA
jgi:prophage regulatory protein